MNEVLLVGLDAGGSKTELLARSLRDGSTSVLIGPAANLQRQGVDGAADVLVGLLRRAAGSEPGVELRAVCAGVSGAGRPENQQALTDALRSRLGAGAPPHLHVVHDAEIALEAAFEGGTGMILIAGTGSVAFARDADGRLARAGGWGYLLGDEGSGYQIGLHGLRAACAAFDGGPATRLRDDLARRLGLATPGDFIDRVYREGWPVQEAAPLVLEAAEAGDAPAAAIVAAQVRRLARQMAWLADRTKGAEPRIALLGGLSRNAYYRRVLAEALADVLPGWRLGEPMHRPVVGALRLAERMAG